jgi:hypothetical protein
MRVAKHGRDTAQQFVAGGVRIAVVDRLEVVEVQHEDCGRTRRPAGAAPSRTAAG